MPGPHCPTEGLSGQAIRPVNRRNGRERGTREPVCVPEQSDDQLLSAARRGDRPALEELLRRYQGRIYRYGLRMCGDPDDAKDVLQETLFAMASRVGDLRGALSLPAWLYTVARSFCIKRRRRSKFAPAVQDSLDRPGLHVTDPNRGPEERVAQRQLEAALAHAIASLTPTHRDVLVLRDIEGLAAADVAQVLGIRVDAVKSRLHRARLALRERLAPGLGRTPEAAHPVPLSGCPDVLNLWSRHLEGEITAEVCTDLERHLVACHRCSAICDSLKRTLAVCRDAADAPVPERVQAQVRDKLERMLAAR